MVFGGEVLSELPINFYSVYTTEPNDLGGEEKFLSEPMEPKLIIKENKSLQVLKQPCFRLRVFKSKLRELR